MAITDRQAATGSCPISPARATRRRGDGKRLVRVDTFRLLRGPFDR